MSGQALLSVTQITQARAELKKRAISCLSSQSVHLLRRIGIRLNLTNTISVGDHIKSWDVWSTVQFIEQHVPKESSILDIGTYASEILSILYRLHYAHLIGVDLDCYLSRMPNRAHIHYARADFMTNPFQSATFSAITAISVIEHGFNGQALLTEVARLLKPGGYFITSFDYWPDKIDTTGINIFGMGWRIFSKQEVLDFIEEAETYGLALNGPLNLEIQQPVMHWGGKDYTFAWLVLQKQLA
jgi:SAM-dependent methyltransferase